MTEMKTNKITKEEANFIINLLDSKFVLGEIKNGKNSTYLSQLNFIETVDEFSPNTRGLVINYDSRTGAVTETECVHVLGSKFLPVDSRLYKMIEQDAINFVLRNGKNNFRFRFAASYNDRGLKTDIMLRPDLSKVTEYLLQDMVLELEDYVSYDREKLQLTCNGDPKKSINYIYSIDKWCIDLNKKLNLQIRNVKKSIIKELYRANKLNKSLKIMISSNTLYYDNLFNIVSEIVSDNKISNLFKDITKSIGANIEYCRDVDSITSVKIIVDNSKQKTPQYSTVNLHINL